MTAFLIVLHILTCFTLILFVLLQPGARGGVGAAFGGAGGQTVFGGRGANTFLAKLTAAAAVVFMLTSISLSYFVTQTSSVMERRAAATAEKDGEKPKDGETKPADGAAPTGDATAPAGDAAAPAPTGGDAAPAPTGGDAAATPPADGSKPAGDAPPAP